LSVSEIQCLKTGDRVLSRPPWLFVVITTINTTCNKKLIYRRHRFHIGIINTYGY